MLLFSVAFRIVSTRQFNGYLKTGGIYGNPGRGRFPDPKLHDAGDATFSAIWIAGFPNVFPILFNGA